MRPYNAGNIRTQTYRVCLIFPVVEVMAVVENVLVGGVETGFHTVLHHLARPGGTLQLLDLNTQMIHNIWLKRKTPRNCVSAGASSHWGFSLNSLIQTHLHI